MTEVWTIPALKEHMEALIAASDRRHTDLATERNRAVDAALAAANEKAAAHNDVLGAMKDQQANYVTKDQAALQFKGLALALAAVVAFATLIAVFLTLSRGAS